MDWRNMIPSARCSDENWPSRRRADRPLYTQESPEFPKSQAMFVVPCSGLIESKGICYYPRPGPLGSPLAFVHGRRFLKGVTRQISSSTSGHPTMWRFQAHVGKFPAVWGGKWANEICQRWEVQLREMGLTFEESIDLFLKVHFPMSMQYPEDALAGPQVFDNTITMLWPNPHIA